MKYFLYSVIAVTSFGCSDIFDITPYDAAPANDVRDLTASNIELWRQQAVGQSAPITIALTSDPHFYYGDLSDVVDRINGDHSIDVVIVPGDLTDQGLLVEFQWTAEKLMELNKPWLAMIGNHDHQGNGKLIYEQMFGARNFHVDLHGYRFIFFDNTVWEAEVPMDLDQLENYLNTSGDLVPIVLMHIPPHDDQLANGSGARILELLASHEVPLFVHGHLHGFADYTTTVGDVRSICVPWPRDRAYVKLVLDADEFIVERISL